MDDSQQRFLDRAAEMIPSLFDKTGERGLPTEYLLGERLIDGRVIRLTLRADVVSGTGNVLGGLGTMQMPMGEHGDG